MTIVFIYQAGLSDCCDIMLRKQVDGLALMVSLVQGDRTHDKTYRLYVVNSSRLSFQLIMIPMQCPAMFDANALQGMNDAVLQLWSREMKIMQIK